MSSVAVLCVAISKSFGAVPVVHDFTLEVERGSILSLLGPSGSGKTTTLRLIAGFEAPDVGRIELDGRVVAAPGVHVPPEKRRVGMVFQDYALFPHLTVSENVAFGLPKGSARQERVQEILSLVGLGELASRRPHELSGGQQQRVALARALAPRPQVLLLDEPFSNLHASLRVQVRREVREILKASNTTAMFVTHDQEEAFFMGDVVAVQRQGWLEQVGPPERVFHEPATRFVAQFMGMADFLPATHQSGVLYTDLGSVPAPVPVSKDTGLELMIRPDDVFIEPSEQGQGRIVERVFRGVFYLYRIELESRNIIHCQLPHTEKYPEGTRVAVRLKLGHPFLCFLDGRAILQE